MPHYPKPFFRKARSCWYVQLHGKQIRLGTDRETAFAQYHRLMAEAPQTELPPSVDGSLHVAVLADRFLDWVSKRRAERTYEWYHFYLQAFVKAYPKITVAELKPFHVERWADSKDCSVSARRNFARAVKRCLRWGKQQGYIDHSPIDGLEIPSAERREDYLSPEGLTELLGYVGGRSFADLITVTYETGCRPQEALRVEAIHVDTEHSRWVFPISQSKGKAMPRVVYLTELAREVTERRMRTYPEGPLFRNSKGHPWTKDSVGCAFDRVHVRMGKEKLRADGVGVTDEEIAERMASLKPTREAFEFSHLEEALDLALLYEEAHGNKQIRDYCSQMLTRFKWIKKREEFGFLRYSPDELEEHEADQNAYVDCLIGKRQVAVKGQESQIIVLDMNEAADEIVEVVSAVISRLLFERHRRLEPRNSYPVHLILEEAHRYVAEKKSSFAIDAGRVFERIAKEGRKYGLFLQVASQRPSELSSTVLSQCSNFVVHRIQNPDDLHHIRQMTPFISDSVLRRLPSLPKQHALIFGSAVNLPTTFRVRDVSPKPRSDDARIRDLWFRD